MSVKVAINGFGRIGRNILRASVENNRKDIEVVAVGPGEPNDKGEKIKPDVSKGDKVVYSKYGGTEIKVDGQEYLILSSRDILAKLGK